MIENETKIFKFKQALLDTGIFKKVGSYGNNQYTCNCPFCGDTKRHMYVKIDLSDDSVPVLYNCFKCNEHGRINNEFLSGLGITNLNVPRFGRKKIDYTNENLNTDKKLEYFNINDTFEIEKGIEYIKTRINVTPSADEMKMFGFISDPCMYYKDILNFKGNDNIKLNQRVWFIMTNCGMIGRCHHDNNHIDRWKKINPNSSKINRGFYLFKKPFDLHSIINVVLCEGIMDCIGLYYNHDCGNNNVFMASLGTDYNSALEYLINRGIFGESVSIKIYIDSNDVRNTYYDNIYDNIFKNISIYHNLSSKDYGVPVEQYDIQKLIK